MEHRLSIGNSNPMADSTRIDGNNAVFYSTPRPHNNLSPKPRSSLSICASSSYTNGTPPNINRQHVSRTSTSISKLARQKLNISQLDPKTYADVHSSGLTTRIVEYQKESSRGLNRSLSHSNVYSSLAQPRRSNIAVSPLGHKAFLPSVAMTRIAPPERSFYCGNTLPSLLRSNSLLGVDKSSEQLSRENRPIMHPPPLQHEIEPTRSVLEELKEISRKRINSGEIQSNDYNSKKSCNRMADYVDHHTHQSHHPQQQHQQQQHQQQMSMMQPQGGFKRQRELTVTVPLRMHFPPIALPQQQQQLQMPVHHYYANSVSPEQLAKRRNCSYGNDIASSLSSSKLHSNKRKLYDIRQTASMVDGKISSSPDNSPRQHASKIQRNQSTSNLHLEHLTRSQSAPITPLPATPAQSTVSAPTLLDRSEATVPARPKLTLFNAAQQEQPEQQQSQHQHLPCGRQLDLKSPDVDASEYAGIQFVKPKQQNTVGSQKNSNLERTQKTKLALMLSSLKGEIYQDEKELSDETDAACPVQPTPLKATTMAANIATTLATPSATPISVTTPTTTGTDTTTKPVILSVTTIVPATATTTNTAATESTVAITTAAATTEADTTEATTTAATTTTEATTSKALPLLSFNNTSNAATIQKSSNSTINLSISTAAGAQSCFILPSTTAGGTTAASTPIPKLNGGTMSFNNMLTVAAAGVTATTAATTTAATVTAAPTSTAMFSFGNAVAAATANNGTAAPATSITANKPAAAAAMFTFGKPATAATTISSATAATTAAATTAATAVSAPIFSFGTAAAAPATATTTVPTTAAAVATKSFTFGNTSNNNDAPGLKLDNWAPKPTEPSSLTSNNNIFGSAFNAPAAATAAEPPKLFGFGNTTAAAPAATLAATNTPTPIFGGTAAATAAKPAFSFGGTPTAANAATAANAEKAAAPANNSNLFSFGAAAGDATKPVAKAMPFSLPSSNSSTNNNNSSSSNMFSFAGSDGPKMSTTAAPATATSSFSFSPAAPASQNAFGFNATAKQTSIFGSNNATASKPFAFGSAAEQQQQQQTPAAAAAGSQTPQQPRAGGFSFASVAQKTEPTNLFSSPTAAATGVVKPSFNFGGNSTPAAAAPSFGGFAAPAAPASNQNKPFAFGSNNSSMPMGGNLFASAVAATQQQNQQQQSKPGGFAFNSGNSSSAAVTQPAATASNAPFTFSGISSTPQINNTAKPFTFGANASNSAVTNVFGNPSGAPTAAPMSNGAFNFSGASSAPGMHATPQQLNSGNLFAPPSTPESRPIRRATRRLQK